MGSPLDRSNRERWSAQVSVPAVRKPLSSSKYSWLQTPCVAVNSPPWLITRTWSVPSTKTIFISPSPTSSTASRSIRLIGARGRPASRASGGGLDRGRPLVPLVGEELSEPLARGLERNPRNHGLEESEHDHLAGLVRADPAALEVEELALVDRADGRGVRRPAAVRLVDLQRRDRDGPGLLRE